MFTGTNLIANSFNTTNHTFGYLLLNCSDSTQILKNSGVASECKVAFGTGGREFEPGKGAILVDGRVFRNHLCGELTEGVLSNSIPTIPSLVG